jgi:hypothetical protein
MKKIIKPATKEESVYYSDFSGKCFGEMWPPVTLTINCSYGSKYDGAEVELHLNDDEMQPLMELVKKSISLDQKNKIKKQLDSSEAAYNDATQTRDWEYCEILSNSISFWNNILDIKQ